MRCIWQQFRRQQYLEVDPTGYMPTVITNECNLPPIRSRGSMLAEMTLGIILVVVGAFIVLAVLKEVFVGP